jgi:hypothetical protein
MIGFLTGPMQVLETAGPDQVDMLAFMLPVHVVRAGATPLAILIQADKIDIIAIGTDYARIDNF